MIKHWNLDKVMHFLKILVLFTVGNIKSSMKSSNKLSPKMLGNNILFSSFITGNL